jgi:hypothetical protein
LNKGVTCEIGKRIYPFDPNIELRDNEIYATEVNISIETSQPFEGIKGASCLSDYLKIPEHVVLDYMHLSLEGFVKQILSNWFETKNHKRNFYLGIKYTLKYKIVSIY